MKVIFSRFIIFSTCFAMLMSAVAYGLVDENELNRLLDEASDLTPVEASATTATKAKTTTIQGGGGEDPVIVQAGNDADTKPVEYHKSAPKTNESFAKIVTRMYTNGLTSFPSEASFNADGLITRQEMSKFISLYALYAGKQRNTNSKCGFKDILKGQRALIPYILSACTMNLLNGANGYARPNSPLTKAEAITVIMRTIRSDLTTNTNPRYKNYYNTARAYGITYDDIKNMNTKVTRRSVAIMFWRACKFQGKCSD